MSSTVPGTGDAAAAAANVDVRYYADLLWRARWLLATSVVVATALAIVTALLRTPVYEAGAMIEIDPPQPTSMTVTDALSGGGSFWQNSDFYNTQYKILRSKTLGERVVKRLKLDDQAPFKGHPDPGTLFMTHVKVAPVPESRLVVVSIEHADPKEAALWANTLADEYIGQSVSGRVESARKAYEWLQERLADTERSMRESQEKLFKSYQQQDLIVPEANVSAVSSSIGKLNEDFLQAQGRRIALEAAIKQVEQMRGAGQSLDAVPQVALDSLVLSLNQQLAQLNLDVSRLREKYTDAHPEVQKVRAQIEQVRRAKDLQADQIVSGLRAELSQVQRREVELKNAIDQQKAQATSQSRKGAELEAIRKEAESSKNLYEVLLQKLHETDIAQSIRNNNVSLVERASPPATPVRPRKRDFASVGALLGLALGIGLVFGRDLLNNTIKDPEELERFLHIELLAAVPRYDETTVNLVAEAYQNLRTSLLFARKDEGGQVVLVTGTAPQEGKTTTLVNLAKLMAASGEKTLALDFDLRRAQLHSRLEIPREPGVTSYFVKHEPIDALIRSTHVPNLFALTAGALPPSPPALLGRNSVRVLLDELRQHFEWVFIDTPPLASVTDALLLARHADMAVFVVEFNKVDKRLLKRNLAALRRASTNVLGAVLNGVNVKARHYYYSYYQPEYTTDDQGGGTVEAPAKEPVASTPPER